MKRNSFFFVIVLWCSILFPTAHAGQFVFEPKALTTVEAPHRQVAEGLRLYQHQFEASHYLFASGHNAGLNWSHGPFVAVRSGERQTFDAVALGWMVAIDNGDSLPVGWHIGAGLVVEGDFKSLDHKRLFGSDNDFAGQYSGGSGIILMTSFAF